MKVPSHPSILAEASQQGIHSTVEAQKLRINASPSLN